MNYETDTFFSYETRMAIIVALLGFVLILSFFINSYQPFKEERDYIKMEIARSDGKEYDYWKRELKKLYLSHIPLIGTFFK